jgi:class 3 adenylate cyclase
VASLGCLAGLRAAVVAPGSYLHQLSARLTCAVGDSVLAYFGVPLAREDDLERAVRAGLDIVAATAKIDVGSAAHVRAGVATGIGLVCARGDRWNACKSVIGKAPNLSCGVRDIAEPGTVLIAASARSLIGDLFECRELAPLLLRASTPAVRTHQVRGEKTGKSRFKALHGTQLSTLVGRRKELDLLLDRWSLIACLYDQPGFLLSRNNPRKQLYLSSQVRLVGLEIF